MENLGTIILMDDEDLLIKITSRIIAKLGYDVQTATNGEEMLEVYKKCKTEGKNIRAVILDLTIANGMGGKDAVSELRKFAPDVYAIATSGDPTDSVMTNYQDYGFNNRIAKPFTIESINSVLPKD